MIKLENIKKSFQVNRKDFTVLRGIDLEIRSGEFIGILDEVGQESLPCFT